MSGPRLYLGRLPLAAFLASGLFALCGLASCTAPTPGYCDNSQPDACGSSGRCDFDAFACVTVEDANPTGTDGRADSPDIPIVQSDAGVDAPVDQPVSNDGGNDARDAAAEAPVDAPKTCPGGCAADGGTPICDPSSGACVGCLESPQCTGGAASVCDTMAHRCVQCVDARDCHNASAPICDNQICRSCRTDSECTGVGPEVCMSHIGRHCATDDETVYVQNGGSCSDTSVGAGTSTTPFCMSQPAINATAPSAIDAGTDAGSDVTPDARAAVAKDLVVMRGTQTLTDWVFGDSRTLTVVGKAPATITGGTSRDGITISGGTVYLRGLRVSASRTGIKGSGGELHADRVVVDGNTGGVFLDNTSFAITNSVIAGNLQSFAGGVTAWSGLFIGTVPAGGPASLFNDTIAGNMIGGVVCVDGPPPTPPPSRTHLSGLIVWGNSPDSDLLGNCSPTSVTMPCCGLDNLNQPLDPKLTSDWHLMSGSPCIGKLASGQSTGYDIDGQPRTGAMVDCGADEFVSTMP